MVLFATDIAARGLDFPTVDWVVQVRATEDTMRTSCGQQCGGVLQAKWRPAA